MNERILEIAKQAGMEYHSEHQYDAFDEQKFAELIVRSCSNIAAHHNSLDAAEDIMKHFGVEE